MTLWLPLCLVACAAGFIQGLTGFGSVLISLPLLSLFLPIKTVIPVVTLFGLTITIFHSIALRTHLRFKRLTVLVAATLPGLPLGVWALTALPAWVLTLAVGLMLVPYGLQALLFTPRPRNLGRGWAALAGFLAGILGGAIGASGPPVIVYTALQPWPRDQAKALLAGYFLTTGGCVVAGQALGGVVTSQVLLYFAGSVPALALGLGLGVWAYARMGERGYRRSMHLLILALGLFMAIRGLLLA